MNNLYIGTFDCEKFWEYDNAKLPKIQDKQADNCILGMDELLIYLGDNQDKLLTRFKIDEVQTDYLKKLGFNKMCFSYEDFSSEMLFDSSQEICTLMTVSSFNLKHFVRNNDCLTPFSVLKNTHTFAKKYNLNGKFPDLKVVENVNSKFFSAAVSYDLGLHQQINLAFSVDEMANIGEKLLHGGAFLIKEEYGVSGKGNLLVDSQEKLACILKYLGKQEKQGKKIRFLMEPFMHKDKDFSTQFTITEKGVIQFESVQILINNAFSYKSSIAANSSFIELLIKNRYFEKIREVGQKLYKAGYFGPVCIDSMLLKDGHIYEVVEINARMSMSYIKHRLDMKYEKLPNRYFTYYNFKIPPTFSYENFLDKMDKNGILFHGNRGILPLTSKMMTINRKKESSYKGRLYALTVGAEDLTDKLRDVAASLNMKLL